MAIPAFQDRGTGPGRMAWQMRLALAVGLGIAAAAYGQSRITFKSGATHDCRVVGFENGIFTVELPDGTRAQTRQDNIVRIEFDAGTAPSLPPEFSRMDPPAPRAVPPPPPAPVEPAAPEPAPDRPPLQARRTVELTLASHWEHRLGRGNIAQRDAARLLAQCGTPRLDSTWHDITLWRDITYLMPLDEARKKLGLGLSSKKSVSSAAFPPGSFFSHEFTGNYEDGMNRLILITDFADQIVGIQMQDNSSRSERWFRFSEPYSTEWSLYNFIRDGRKANPNWEIGFYVCKGPQRIRGYPPSTGAFTGVHGPTGVNENVIRIDSDLYSIRKNRYGLVEDARSRERVRLLLPQPIVDLMLHIIQQSR